MTDYLPAGQPGPGAEYVLDECPGCGKPRHFYWNTETCKGKCHACQFVIIGKRRFIRLTGGDGEGLEGLRPWRERPTHPLASNARSMDCAWDHDLPRRTLSQRGVTEDVARKIPIRYSPDHGYMFLNLDPLSPELPPVIVYRSVYRWPNKWIGLPGVRLAYYGFGLNHLPPGISSVLLVEGVYDVLGPGLLGKAVALMGSSFNPVWAAALKHRGIQRVVTWLDPDEAGRSGTRKVLQTLQAWELKVSSVKLSSKRSSKLPDPGDLRPGHPVVESVIASLRR